MSLEILEWNVKEIEDEYTMGRCGELALALKELFPQLKIGDALEFSLEDWNYNEDSYRDSINILHLFIFDPKDECYKEFGEPHYIIDIFGKRRFISDENVNGTFEEFSSKEIYDLGKNWLDGKKNSVKTAKRLISDKRFKKQFKFLKTIKNNKNR